MQVCCFFVSTEYKEIVCRNYPDMNRTYISCIPFLECVDKIEKNHQKSKIGRIEMGIEFDLTVTALSANIIQYCIYCGAISLCDSLAQVQSCHLETCSVNLKCCIGMRMVKILVGAV